MKRFLLTVAAMAALVASPTTHAVSAADTPRPDRVNHADKKKFSWSGSVEVTCRDGKCQVVTSAGLVFATNSFEARLSAEASLRQQAGGVGTVKEGTIKLTISGF